MTMLNKLSKEDLEYIFPPMTPINMSIKITSSFSPDYFQMKKGYVNGIDEKTQSVILSFEDYEYDKKIYWKELINTTNSVLYRNYKVWKILKVK